MREEDNSVYIDKDTINDIYNTVISFVDRIFEKGVVLERQSFSGEKARGR